MNSYKKVNLAVILAMSSTTAFALEPAPISYSIADVVPTLEVSESYDDNYLLTNAETASWVTSVTPSVGVTIYGEKTTYQIDYALNYQAFDAKNADNLVNHYLSASTELEFDVRNKLAIQTGYNKTQSSAAALTPGVLNSFNTFNAGGNYTYGTDTSTGNVEIGANHVQKRSDNGANLDQENDSTVISTAFIYRVTDKSRLLAEIKATDFKYISNTNLNSKNIAYLVGARWEATAKTTGNFKIGIETKDFSDSSRKDTDLTSWEGNIEWSPLTYSTVTLTTSQKIEEGSYTSNYTNSRNSIVNWAHDWGSGYTSNLNYTNTDKEYASTIARKDTIDAYGVGVKYAFRRWMDIGFDYQASNQRSTDATYDYNRNLYKLSVNISL
ncbi:outer membrane beta-barrel protein [Thiosulfativibrio zosterae]|uniref:Uncharacterized protein n=1 Tax=Thiosulfativibrio zosterae TaxID=2675053 RepID=A0A6F8PQS6_9GAMM|nr:outer membrane beta-barrel protein [Thiosulfativibrio zosterae]BBP44482.1 hypothetical protein THMIRHAT_22280 [Thiosulfativibrio zosterae]